MFIFSLQMKDFFISLKKKFFLLFTICTLFKQLSPKKKEKRKTVVTNVQYFILLPSLQLTHWDDEDGEELIVLMSLKN